MLYKVISLSISQLKTIGIPYVGTFCGDIDLDQNPAALLLAINAREQAEALDLLKTLLAQGLTPEDIALHYCDELGRVKYSGPNDSNSFMARYENQLVDFSQGRILAPLPAGYAYYEDSYYRPSVAKIRLLRSHIAVAIEQERRLSPLRTPHDYYHYFGQIGRTRMSRLIRELGFLEPSQGCPAYCNDQCTMMPERKITHHIPYEVLRWLFYNFREEFVRNNTVLYGGSDIKYYADAGFDGADLLQMHWQETGSHSEVSTSFGLDLTTISFLKKHVLVNGGFVHRISGLRIGDPAKAYARLMAALTAAQGSPIDSKTSSALWLAVEEGAKDHLDNTLAGNAVKTDTPEGLISRVQVGCLHGSVLRAGKGFYAASLQATSKLFPGGCYFVPVHTDPQQSLESPDLLFFFNEGSLTENPLVPAPRWKTARHEPTDPLNAQENKPMWDTARYRCILSRAAHASMTSPDDGKLKSLFGTYIEILKVLGPCPSFEQFWPLLVEIQRQSILVLDGWINFVNRREEYYRRTVGHSDFQALALHGEFLFSPMFRAQAADLWDVNHSFGPILSQICENHPGAISWEQGTQADNNMEYIQKTMSELSQIARRTSDHIRSNMPQIAAAALELSRDYERRHGKPYQLELGFLFELR